MERGVLTVRSRTMLQVGDLHLQARELADQREVLFWIAERVRQEGVGLVVVAGDLAGISCPHLSRPAERGAMLDFLIAVRGAGASVVILRGNHDVAEDWRWLDALSSVRWVTRPESFTLSAPDGEAVLHCLPYPDRSWLAVDATDSTAATAKMEQALHAIVAGFSAVAPGVPSVLAGHLNIRGAMTSTGQPMVGTEVELPVDAIAAAGVDVALLNHIHLPQTMPRLAAGAPVVHVGSPWPTNYGETEEKRVVLATVEDGRFTIRSVPTPCITRVTLDVDWRDDRWHVVGDLPAFGPRTRVRLRYHYDEDDRPDWMSALDLVGDALEIKTERHPRRRAQARMPEVAAATSVADRILAYEITAGREVDATFEQAVRQITVETAEVSA